MEPLAGAVGVHEELQSWTVAELRGLRSRCRSAEDELSLLRRLVQGRLDIVRAEQERRSAGVAGGLAAALADLPVTLAGAMVDDSGHRAVRAPSSAVAPTLVAPLDAVCDVEGLRRLPELDPDELAGLCDHLAVLERDVSERRRALFRTLDALSVELTHRYARGDASVDDLLESAEQGVAAPDL